MNSLIKSLIDDLVDTQCANPFKFLGPHRSENQERLVLRCWYPDATSISVIDTRSGKDLGKMNALVSGLFEMSFPTLLAPALYQLSIICDQRKELAVYDPYQFRHLCFPDDKAAPDCYRLYRYLGARLTEYEIDDAITVSGVLFLVYAPNARSVAVVGSFNKWDGRMHPMEKGEDGIWRLFIPGVAAGDLYKYEIRSAQGYLLPHKADPYGLFAEQPPGNASIVYDHDSYCWQDENWKPHSGLDRPVSIYEVHLGSWKRKDGQWLSYQALANELLSYVQQLGFTHIELLPVMEHPFFGSWGYQPTGLFAPTSRFGSPDDFKAFIDRFHQAGIGVILDWVPAHFPSDPHGLASFDGTALYEYADPKRDWHPDWNTHIYDYGKPEIRHFLISNAMYWLDYFHLDGLRVDAVASMLYLDYSRKEGQWERNSLGGNEHLEAVQFLKELNETLYGNYPDRMIIAEDSSSWPGVSMPTYDGGLGFGFKWNMGWMHDSLAYMRRDPVHRKYHHDEMMFSMVYFYDEHFILPLSHDETVYGKGSLLNKMPGDEANRFANLRAYFGFMFGHPGKKLLFMGGELGSHREWSHDDQLEWELLATNPLSNGLQKLVTDLNHFYQTHPALWLADYDKAGFEWLIIDDRDQSVFAFYRHSFNEAAVVVISNMTPVVRDHYKVGVPFEGCWVERLNTDAAIYGGSGRRNSEKIITVKQEMHRQRQCLELTLPALSTLFLTFSVE